jgi:hypothetical protein
MIRGGLFTRFFLEDGIRETDAYRQQNPAEVIAFTEAVRRQWAKLAQIPRPLEAETEAEFIHPILDQLGWHRLPRQEPGRGRRDIADELLFLSEEAKDRAAHLARTADRFRHGVVVVENEARDTLLDRGSATHEAPSSQLLRYTATRCASPPGMRRSRRRPTRWTCARAENAWRRRRRHTTRRWRSSAVRAPWLKNEDSCIGRQRFRGFGTIGRKRRRPVGSTR